MLSNAIWVGDHRPVRARVARLTALTTPRTRLLGPVGPGGRRITRRRQRAVTRIAGQLTLKLLDPSHQRQHQINDAAGSRSIAARSSAHRNIPCDQEEPSPITRRPPERVRSNIAWSAH